MTKRIFTKEHRMNMSKSWNYNKHFTKEVREKLSKSHKGKKPHSFSKETRKKMSLAKIGHTPWNKGRKGVQLFSKETRKRMGESRKGRKLTEEHKLKIKLNHSKYWKGRVVPENRKRQVSNKMKGKMPKNIELLKEYAKKQIIPLKDTKIEVKIQNFLKQLHIEFHTHYYISGISKSYRCDIFIPEQKGIGQKTIIEADGCFYHCCPICNQKKYDWTIRISERDKIRTKELKEKGYRVIRLWEHEIKKMELNYLKNIIY